MPPVCGAAAHEWLPADGMGAVILDDEQALSNLSAAAVEASRSDVPFDTADPLFRFGHGLSL